MARRDSLQLLTVIALCIAIIWLSSISGRGTERGSFSSSEGLRFAIVSYDLHQGDRIHYEWESNSLFRFVITTEPSNPQLAEFVNVTGISAEGSFVSPGDAKYYLQVTPLEGSGGFYPRIDFETFRITEFSETMILARPLILAIMATALAGLLVWNWKERRTAPAETDEKESLTFWRFFTGNYSNWIAIVIGAVVLTISSVLVSADSSLPDRSFLVGLVASAGNVLVAWGLLFGLVISHGNYQERKLELLRARQGRAH